MGKQLRRRSYGIPDYLRFFTIFREFCGIFSGEVYGFFQSYLPLDGDDAYIEDKAWNWKTWILYLKYYSFLDGLPRDFFIGKYQAFGEIN